MKKIFILSILILFSIFSFAQFEAGEYINADTIKKEGVNVFVDHLQNLSTNDSNFVAVNFGTYVDWVDLIGRIDNLDSLGIFATDIQAGEQSINTGTTSITFPGAFDSTDLDISVVPYVRRTSDNAVVDYVVDNISTTGFDVTVWEDACYIRYIASQKQPESNAFFETILHQSDTVTIRIDTSQVRNLQTFVENHSTGRAETDPIYLAQKDTVILNIDFLDLTIFTYNVPMGMTFTNQVSESTDATLDPVLNTALNQFDKLIVTPSDTGLIILSGHKN